MAGVGGRHVVAVAVRDALVLVLALVLALECLPDEHAASDATAVTTASKPADRRATGVPVLAAEAIPLPSSKVESSGTLASYRCSVARANKPRAITMRWISLVPSPIIMSGASR